MKCALSNISCITCKVNTICEIFSFYETQHTNVRNPFLPIHMGSKATKLSKV